MDPKIREKFEEKGVSQIIYVYDLSKQLANKIPYSRKYWWGSKFVSLAVYITTAKLKSAKISY